MSKHETAPNRNRTAEVLALTGAALLLGGAATANAAASAAPETLRTQRVAEQRAFGGLKTLEAELPDAIDAALSVEGKHFKPGKTARYSLSVGAGTAKPNVYNWTTMQMAYVKGSLKTVTIIEGLSKPAALNANLAQASYTRLTDAGKGFDYVRQSVDKKAHISSIMMNPIPSLAELPHHSLDVRRGAIEDLSRVETLMQGVLTGYAKAGPAPQTL